LHINNVTFELDSTRVVDSFHSSLRDECDIVVLEMNVSLELL